MSTNSVTRGDDARRKEAKEQEEKQNARILYSHSGVNALLTSQVGKMSLHELQSAVVSQQQLMRRQEAQVQDTLAQTGAQADNPHHGHPFDHTHTSDVDDAFPGDNAQMREMIFLRGLSLYEQHERSLQINPTKHRIGHTLMTEQQRYDLEYARESRKAHEKAAARDAARRQSGNVTSSERVISMVGETSTRQPTFIVDEAESWPSRKRVRRAAACMTRLLGRFLASVNKLIVRQRVDDRLSRVASHAHHQSRRDLASGAIDARAAHPLSLSSVRDEESHLQRDLLLHTNTVQGVGHARGHDAVTRTQVAIDAIEPTKELVVFDEIIPFDTHVLGYPVMQTPVVPTYMSTEWLSGLRTGAWDESTLRGPRGETLDEEKKVAESSSDAPLAIHAHLPPSTRIANNDTHAATTAASPALIDVEAQTSKPMRPPPVAKTVPASPTRASAANAAPAATASAATRTSAGAKSIPLEMPAQLLAHHPVAQQHSIVRTHAARGRTHADRISSPSLSVPVTIMPVTETSWSSAFRCSAVSGSANGNAAHDAGYYYTRESPASAALRTIPTMPTITDMWRPRREATINLAILGEFSLPVRTARTLRSQPKEDDLSDTDDDEYTPNLRFQSVRPTPERARLLFDPASASTAAVAAPAQASASAAAPIESGPVSGGGSGAALDLGLGLSLLSTAIHYPPALQAAAGRAQAAAAAAAAAAASAAVEAAEAAAVPTSRKDRAAAAAAAAAASSGGVALDEKGRSRRTKDAPPVVAQVPPRQRPPHSGAWSASEVGLGVSLSGEMAAAAVAAAAAPPSHAAAAAITTVTSTPVSLPSSIGWGSGGPAAAASVQRALAMESVRATGALTRQMQDLLPSTAHAHTYLTGITRQ